MDTEVNEEAAPEPAPEPMAAPPSHNAKAAWIVAGVATAIALVAAMVAVSAMQRDDGNSPNSLAAGSQVARLDRPVSGEITSIDGTSFKVKETFPNGESQTTTVSTGKDTTFRQSVEGSVSDLAVGDTVAVNGTTADNVLTATRIVETATQANVVGGARPGMVFEGGGPSFKFDGGARPDGARPRVFQSGSGNMRLGEITKIEGDTLTLSALDGSSVTVKTTAGTEVRINKRITMASLKKGDEVRVVGAMKDDTMVANEVIKGALDEQLAS